MNDVTKFETIVKPALHTFWQSFAGLLVAWWFASGISLAHQITNVADARRVALSALGALAAMALSAIKSTIAVYTARKKAASGISEEPDPDQTVDYLPATPNLAPQAFASGKSTGDTAPAAAPFTTAALNLAATVPATTTTASGAETTVITPATA